MSFEYLLNETHDADFEFKRTVGTEQDGYTAYVSKVGGGTLGKKYEGAWLVRVYAENGVASFLEMEEVFTTGTPHSHKWVARECLRDVGAMV